MNYIGNKTNKTSTGFKQTVKQYQAQNCGNCPMNGACHKSKGNRIIQVNEQLNLPKAQAPPAYSTVRKVSVGERNDVTMSNRFCNIKQNPG